MSIKIDLKRHRSERACLYFNHVCRLELKTTEFIGFEN